MSDRICSVEGCQKKHAARGFCQQHYTTEYRPLMPDARKCSIEGCDKKHNAHGLCRAHYGRMRRHGTLESFRPRRDGCAVEGCDRPNHCGGYCLKHLRRVRKHGDPQMVTPREGSDHYHWAGDDITYSGLHQRVRNIRGPASTHQCVDCFGPAHDWSYDNTGIGEREDVNRGMKYSTDIQQYSPRCSMCHRAFDQAVV
jgi:hypothetical protein